MAVDVPPGLENVLAQPPCAVGSVLEAPPGNFQVDASMLQLQAQVAMLQTQLALVSAELAYYKVGWGINAKPQTLADICIENFDDGKCSLSGLSIAKSDDEMGPELPSLPNSLPTCEDLKVVEATIDGISALVAKWRISGFTTKILGGTRRPIVSPAFQMFGHEGIRLMVYPEVTIRSGTRMRDEKLLLSKKLADGHISASLKLKVPRTSSVPLRYHLKVGKAKRGLLEFNFETAAIDNRGHFEMNWLDELNEDGSLDVCLEMLQPEQGFAS